MQSFSFPVIYETPGQNMTYKIRTPEMDPKLLYFYRKFHKGGSDV